MHICVRIGIPYISLIECPPFVELSIVSNDEDGLWIVTVGVGEITEAEGGGSSVKSVSIIWGFLSTASGTGEGEDERIDIPDNSKDGGNRGSGDRTEDKDDVGTQPECTGMMGGELRFPSEGVEEGYNAGSHISSVKCS